MLQQSEDGHECHKAQKNPKQAAIKTGFIGGTPKFGGKVGPSLLDAPGSRLQLFAQDVELLLLVGAHSECVRARCLYVAKTRRTKAAISKKRTVSMKRHRARTHSE